MGRILYEFIRLKCIEIGNFLVWVLIVAGGVLAVIELAYLFSWMSLQSWSKIIGNVFLILTGLFVFIMFVCWIKENWQHAKRNASWRGKIIKWENGNIDKIVDVPSETECTLKGGDKIPTHNNTSKIVG